jgi:hypothetical protein
MPSRYVAPLAFGGLALFLVGTFTSFDNLRAVGMLFIGIAIGIRFAGQTKK